MITMAAWIGWAAGLLGCWAGHMALALIVSVRVQSSYFAERKGGWLGVVRVGACLY